MANEMVNVFAFYQGHDPAKDAEAEAIMEAFDGEWIGQGLHFPTGERDIQWLVPRNKVAGALVALQACGFRTDTESDNDEG
jgi:hypothetical protein